MLLGYVIQPEWNGRDLGLFHEDATRRTLDGTAVTASFRPQYPARESPTANTTTTTTQCKCKRANTRLTD